MPTPGSREQTRVRPSLFLVLSSVRRVSHRLWLPELGLFALLWGIFIAPLTRIGIAQTDDAEWVYARYAHIGVVTKFAKDEGRIWPLVSGPVQLTATGLLGTVWEV